MTAKETFICKGCEGNAPVEFRHEVKPEYCIFCYMTPEEEKELDLVLNEGLERVEKIQRELNL